MERRTFLLRYNTDTSAEKLEMALPEMKRIVEEHGGYDFSVWRADNMIFGYFETENTAVPNPAGVGLCHLFETQLADTVSIISVCNMRLMYSAINRPIQDKSKIGAYRVFMAKLKPGCADEYLKRHHGLELIARGQNAIGDADPEKMPSSNMTIWCSGDYICGYNEMEEPLSPDDTNAGGNVEWEMNMLKIIDWITDDGDRFSGLHHEPAVRLI